jgi:hypothetical protein
VAVVEQELATFVSPSDLEVIRDALIEINKRIARFQRSADSDADATKASP